MWKRAVFQSVVVSTEVAQVRELGGATMLSRHSVVDVATDCGSRAPGKTAVLVSRAEPSFQVLRRPVAVNGEHLPSVRVGEDAAPPGAVTGDATSGLGIDGPVTFELCWAGVWGGLGVLNACKREHRYGDLDVPGYTGQQVRREPIRVDAFGGTGIARGIAAFIAAGDRVAKE